MDQFRLAASHRFLLGPFISVGTVLLFAASTAAQEYASIRPLVIPIDFSLADDGRGSLIAADLDGDGHKELVVTAPGHIGAYRLDAMRLWRLEADVRVSAGPSESAGLPGHHAPGVQVADIDGDGAAELLFLDSDGALHVHDARTAREKKALRIDHPPGSERWEHLAVVNLRGHGDRDLALQATNARGYRVGHYVAAFAFEGLDAVRLWEVSDFGALAHGPFRPADLNGDGLDEICGFTLLDPQGRRPAWRYPPISPEFAGGASFHIDALVIADVRPEVPGLEVVLLEEGRNYVGLVNFDRGLLWWETHGREEPQNAAVGEFDPDRPGLEIWCRSRHDTHQKPWVFDAQGRVISRYEMAEVAPEGWTIKGVEVIAAIDWTGEATQLAAAKERHQSGDVGLFEPVGGRFVARFAERADRIYVADVAGDWREEIIVVSANEIHVYQNPAPNPRPDQPRLWNQQHYRRGKMNWNYYSP